MREGQGDRDPLGVIGLPLSRAEAALSGKSVEVRRLEGGDGEELVLRCEEDGTGGVKLTVATFPLRS